MGAIVIVYIFLAPFFFNIFLPQYNDAVIYSQVLSVYLVFSPRSLITTALKAQRKIKELYLIRTIGQIGKIILIFPLLKYFGLWGAIFSVIISDLFLYVLYFFVFKRLK